MLIEKEVIRDGTYFYIDEKTKLPRKLVVTPELRKHWHDSGNEMISLGLPVPVPYEHDFAQHPMTPKEQLLNNAGEVKKYTLKGDALFSTVDVQDPEVKNKIGHSIRWTSPWFNSFTDGSGKKWNNVISHLALTTRPRATNQQAFSSVAAALSMATETKVDNPINVGLVGDEGGFCLSRAGRLYEDATTKELKPTYPMAFSMWSGGVKLSDGDFPPKKAKSKGDGPPKKSGDSDGGKKPAPSGDGKGPPKPGADGGKPEAKPGEPTEVGEEDLLDDEEDGDVDPLADAIGDVKMEELLCDLLQALGVPMPEDSSPHEFKRHLYEAAMCKIKDLAAKGDPNSPQNTAKAKIPGAAGQANPLMNQVQQEQQPMYMSTFSLEEINKLPDETMKSVALSMYNENVKATAKAAELEKRLNSLNDAKLNEEKAKRDARVMFLGRLSPRVKADLDAMSALPSMALSMGDGGAVIDPMATTLAMLEKGLADIPQLLTADHAALSIVPQPRDGEMTDERADQIADELSRNMGCAPAAKAS